MTIQVTGVAENRILVESLFDTIKKRDAEIKRIQDRAFDNSVAASILRAFLVDKHPELTTELAEFTLEKVNENGYGVPTIASGGICALEYHGDTLDNKELDNALKKLGAMVADSL